MRKKENIKITGKKEPGGFIACREILRVLNFINGEIRMAIVSILTPPAPLSGKNPGGH